MGFRTWEDGGGVSSPTSWEAGELWVWSFARFSEVMAGLVAVVEAGLGEGVRGTNIPAIMSRSPCYRRQYVTRPE